MKRNTSNPINKKRNLFFFQYSFEFCSVESFFLKCLPDILALYEKYLKSSIAVNEFSVTVYLGEKIRDYVFMVLVFTSRKIFSFQGNCPLSHQMIISCDLGFLYCTLCSNPNWFCCIHLSGNSIRIAINPL